MYTDTSGPGNALSFLCVPCPEQQALFCMKCQIRLLCWEWQKEDTVWGLDLLRRDMGNKAGEVGWGKY